MLSVPPDVAQRFDAAMQAAGIALEYRGQTTVSTYPRLPLLENRRNRGREVSRVLADV